MRLTNVLGIASKAFGPGACYPEDDAIRGGPPGGDVEQSSIIRWRYKQSENGDMVPESNARCARPALFHGGNWFVGLHSYLFSDG